jgi:hypothetical protein
MADKYLNELDPLLTPTGQEETYAGIGNDDYRVSIQVLGEFGASIALSSVAASGFATESFVRSEIARRSNQNFTFDRFDIQTNQYSFTLSKSPIWNSEIVILNGLVLTMGLDYDMDDKVITLVEAHQTKIDSMLTVKYAHVVEETGIGFMSISDGVIIKDTDLMVQ